MRRLALLGGITLGLSTSLPDAAADDARRPAERVVALRTEVDQLAHRLESERRRAQDALAALRIERAELERQLRLERVRAETLDRLERERKQGLESLEQSVRERLEPLRRAVEIARAYVEESLPFRREARLAQLREIEANLAESSPSLGDGLARLWRFVEEEEALTRELGTSQQPVAVDGERQLVDVARVGMALLYFRSVDGRIGWARPTEDGWSFEVVSDPVIASDIRALVEAFDENQTLGPQRIVVPPEVDEVER